MFFWSVNSASEIKSNSRMDRTDSKELTLHSARNMTVCGQLVMREWEDFSITDVVISSAAGVKASWCFAENVVFNDGVPYPDKMSTKKTMKVLAHTAQIIWVTLEVKSDAPTGTEAIGITVKTDKGDFSTVWSLVIHKAVLPDGDRSDFSHEYFFNGVSYFSSDTQEIEPPVTPFYDYKRYSDKWWELMDNAARTMKDMRVNTVNITVMPLLSDSGSKRTGELSWDIKYEKLDESIEHFIKYGAVKYIAVSHIIQPVDGGSIQSFDESGNIIRLDIGTPESEAFAKAFYKGMYEHFAEKGWLDLLLMRLQDEPHISRDWKWAREKCREYMPGILCGDALDTHETATELDGYCDIFVPRLEVFDRGEDFYKRQQANGKQVWCYSCCYPEEKYWLNKFIDLPHSYSRLIEWGCFSQGLTGFLHWGFAYWSGEMYGMDPKARFKGDGYIVYPDIENNGYLLSARAIATRDGVEDWELLHMLEKFAPDTAKAISRRIVKKFDDFSRDLSGCEIDNARNDILTLLDAYCR